LCRTSQLVHGDTSLSPPTPWDVIASREIHVAATRLTAMAALQRRAMQFGAEHVCDAMHSIRCIPPDVVTWLPGGSQDDRRPLATTEVSAEACRSPSPSPR
jgi:hypothetical protein